MAGAGMQMPGPRKRGNAQEQKTLSIDCYPSSMKRLVIGW
jgi:hypothetical protein